jgi:hypothetical protein
MASKILACELCNISRSGTKLRPLLIGPGFLAVFLTFDPNVNKPFLATLNLLFNDVIQFENRFVDQKL